MNRAPSINLDDHRVVSRRKKTRIGLLSCIWRRHDLTDIFLNHLEILRNNLAFSIDLIPIIIGSEGDVSSSMCERYNFAYFDYPNRPLSGKWEYGINVSSIFDLDAVIILGSDDFINDKLILVYNTLLSEGVQLAGLIDSYFLNLNVSPSRLIHWHGYGSSASCLGQPHRLGETIGLGRLFSRELLEKLQYSLWDSVELNSGLDFYAQQRLRQFGYLPIDLQSYLRLKRQNDGKNVCGQVGVTLNETSAFAVDIKSGTQNITAFDKYVACPSTHHHISSAWQVLKINLGEETASKLLKLSKDAEVSI